jgi:hypothetical protein
LADFLRAVGLWWLGGVFLLLDIAGAASFDEWRGLPVWLLAGVGVLLLLVGAYRAYAEVATDRDFFRGELESPRPRFTIRAGTPHGATFQGRPIIRIKDVYLLNRSATPMQIRFTLVAARGSATLDMTLLTASGQRVAAPPNYFANPTHLDAHSNRTADLAWTTPGDATPFVIEGTVLRVLDEQSHSRVEIPLPTPHDGFVYPENVPSP